MSQPGDRDEANGHLHSPEDQRDRMLTLCEREGWRLFDTYPEMKVSGSAPPADQPGLARAVAAVQTGAPSGSSPRGPTRLWRSNEVRAQVLRLVEGERGEVWSADEGQITCREPGRSLVELGGPARCRP